MKNLFYKLSLSFLIFVLVSCSKDEEPTIINPTIEITSDQQNAEITFTSVKISGNVISDGGSEIISRGVCWSTSSQPTIANDKIEVTANSFTCLIENLTANTTYYFRVFATNSSGTSYSNEQVFSTSSLGNTTWDFLLIYDTTFSWHADVTFYADGTTKYDEPAFPGQYITYGTWTLDGNTLFYDMDSSNPNNVYQFTGTLSDNYMSGTYTYGTNPDKSWTATKY